MVTHGIYGFYYKDKYYVYYNPCDSYPEELGCNIAKQVLDTIKKDELDKWKSLVEKLKIKEYSQPIDNMFTPKLFDILKRGFFYKYTTVVNIFGSYIYKCYDENDSPIFSDYSYIINFDKDLLEFYEGEEKSVFKLDEKGLNVFLLDASPLYTNSLEKIDFSH